MKARYLTLVTFAPSHSTNEDRDNSTNNKREGAKEIRKEAIIQDKKMSLLFLPFYSLLLFVILLAPFT